MYINSYGRLVYDDCLSHHGILGQKYGVRNGPPYPLGSGAHSASELKAGWRDSLKGKNPDKYASRRKAASAEQRYGSSSDKTSDKKKKEKKDSDNTSAAFFCSKNGAGCYTDESDRACTRFKETNGLWIVKSKAGI